MIVAIAPLHREYGLRELVLASYQAVSGAGQLGVDTLHDQLSKVAGDRTLGSRTATSATRSATTSAPSRPRWR